MQSLRTGQLPDDLANEDYTSVETGDTSIPQTKSPLPSDSQSHHRYSLPSDSLPTMTGEHLVTEKSEVEVSIKPPEVGDVARV